MTIVVDREDEMGMVVSYSSERDMQRRRGRDKNLSELVADEDGIME